jgi:hypothetical protein
LSITRWFGEAAIFYGMDSYFYKLLLDRIYRIIWIYYYSLFPEETKNTPSPSAKRSLPIIENK